MESVSAALDKATTILKSLDGTTLTPDQLEKTISGLSQINMIDLIGHKPAGTDPGGKTDARQNQSSANELNKKADLFNDELDRIKRMRQTLNLEALDPVINAARKLIHPVYQYTADLQQDNDD